MTYFYSIKLAALVIALCLGCTSKSPDTKDTNQTMSNKISFDLAALNEDGLYGPPDGLRALDYEFCIPAQEALAEAVGVTRQTIIAIEKGNYTPSVMLALKFGAIFKVSVESIFKIHDK